MPLEKVTRYNCLEIGNMKLSKQQVEKVAKLANLTLTPQQFQNYSKQLSAILDYFEQLKQVETEGVEPTYNVTGNTNITREDKVYSSLTQEESLQNTTSKKDSFFVTKGVFSDE